MLRYLKKLYEELHIKYILHFAGRNPKMAGVCLGKNWKKLV